VHSDELVTLVEDALNELKALDTCVLNVGRLTSVTDHMVISSGTSSRHVRSIAEKVIEKAKAAGRVPLGVEGQQYGEWVLVDLGDVVVHLMQPKVRNFYNLEKLWNMETQPDSTAGSTRAKPGH
jgi:ribosome-associated protein